MGLKELFTKAKESAEEIEKDRIFLFLLQNETYQTELLKIVKDVEERFSKILYLCVNKPAEKVRENLEKNEVNTKKFLFVDGITKSVSPNVIDHGITYISTPKNFEKFNTELNQILEREKPKCVIFDSLSTMLTYQEEITIINFTHDLITRLMVAHASGEFICLSEDVKSDLVKNVSMFVDKVIDTKYKQEEVKEGKNIEKMQKLEKELESVRKAYVVKFLSKASYLKTKKRVEDNMRKLKAKE